ncbi:MAG: four helix bundle protein [Bacteroidetes bacterium]|nr:four helix bundle protein [Bacteroidota bacterium]
MKANVIVEKAFAFSLSMIELYKYLQERRETVISKQLLRSGTSIGANVEESTVAQTRKDFITKMSIASKEARETKYWLRLLQESQMIKGDYKKYIEGVEEIIRILTSIVKTSQNNTKSINNS